MSDKPGILLAVSSGHLIKLITRLLEDSFAITSVSTDEDLWARLQHSDLPSLMICDLELAVGELEIMARIRRSHTVRLAAIPVLLLVAEQNSDGQRDVAISAGATDFINVPFSSSELVTRTKLHAQLIVANALKSDLTALETPATRTLSHLVSENLFISRLEQEISFSRRHNSFISIARIKVDSLSAIFKEKGKPAVIELVKSISALIQKTARSEDVISYIGKGTFLMLYPATNGIGASIALKRIRQKLETLNLELEGTVFNPTISVGLVSSHVNDKTTYEIVSTSAEKRLNEAISNGGNCVISQNLGAQKQVLSIDSAIRMIENEQIEDIKPHLKASLTRLLPLIEVADDQLDLDIEHLLDRLKEKLAVN